MGVVVTKSAAITNRDASPVVLSNSAITRANVKKAFGVVASANGDSIGSTYLFCSIPSNAIVYSAEVTLTADIGTTGAMDVGLYDTTANGGAVVSAHFFTAALDVSDILVKSQLVLSSSGIVTSATYEKRVWELLGLATDPRKMYDVVGTLTAASDGAGSIALEVAYAE